MTTFDALGDATYFTDARYQGQTVNMRDIWSISFLEPATELAPRRPGSPTRRRDRPGPRHLDTVKAVFCGAGPSSTPTPTPCGCSRPENMKGTIIGNSESVSGPGVRGCAGRPPAQPLPDS